MKIAVVGLGLVSPRGTTPEAHAFGLRAGVCVPVAPAFMGPDGKAMRVAYCPFLGASASLEQRVHALAERALGQATGPLVAARARGASVAFEVIAGVPVGAPNDPVRVAVTRAAAPFGRPSFVHGDTAVFSALRRADAGPVVFVAVDSYVDEARLTDVALRTQSPWAKRALRPSEAAAAFVFMPEQTASALGLSVLAEVDALGLVAGAGGDDDDVPADGVAMTELLRKLDPSQRAVAAFGQSDVDALRRAEWQLATARARDRMVATYASVTFEEEVGRVGAAAGAANLALGIAALRHRTLDGVDPRGTFLAWAIEPGGTRGLAAATVRGGARG